MQESGVVRVGGIDLDAGSGVGPGGGGGADLDAGTGGWGPDTGIDRYAGIGEVRAGRGRPRCNQPPNHPPN